jgi:hypothetical protein
VQHGSWQHVQHVSMAIGTKQTRNLRTRHGAVQSMVHLPGVMVVRALCPGAAFCAWTMLSALLHLRGGRAEAQELEAPQSGAAGLAAPSDRRPPAPVAWFFSFSRNSLPSQSVLHMISAWRFWKSGTLQRWWQNHSYGVHLVRIPKAACSAVTTCCILIATRTQAIVESHHASVCRRRLHTNPVRT